MQELDLSVNETSSRAEGREVEQIGFADAFSRRRGYLTRIIAGMGLGGESDDILQEVYLAALRRPGRWRTDKELVSWLIQVTVNSCMQEFRRRRHARLYARRSRNRPGALRRPD